VRRKIDRQEPDENGRGACNTKENIDELYCFKAMAVKHK
jgi:hypothetical protein